MQRIIFIAVIVGVSAFLAILFYGVQRWNANTGELRRRLHAARLPVQPAVVHFQELEALPAPVQRYFRLVLKEGQAMVAGVQVQHSGSFNMGETADQWKPFTSDQMVITRRPGFDWNGKVSLVPGVDVRVHDAYVAGEGILHASLFGLFPVADLRGVGDIAEGELMRFFAEAAWYPTALLPSQGVHWEPIDEYSAYATLTEGAIRLTMRFTFNRQGLIDTVYADSRGRMIAGKTVPTPWQGRFWHYEVRGGMLVPLEGEVEWMPAEGAKPYWRGLITRIEYKFAEK